MKYILKLTTTAVLSAALFSGCIKETFPTDGATADQLAQSPTALLSMVNAIPTAMIAFNSTGAGSSGFHWDFGYPSVMLALDAMCEDMPVMGEAGYDWFASFAVNNGLAYIYYPCIIGWDNYYPWIMSCNDVIELVKGTKNATLGMAYAYRAKFYLDLARMYRYKEHKYLPTPVYDNAPITNLTVPIVTEDTTEEMAAENPRATVEEIFEFILTDLKNAEECLADYSRPDKSKPDLSVVYGLMARTYLELSQDKESAAENFRQAALYARKAIAASGCTPLTQSQWEDENNGFNNMASNNAWMWGLKQARENVNNLLNYVAFLSSEQNWMGYGSDVHYGINRALYESIPNSDFRKHSWLDPNRSFYDYRTCNTQEVLDKMPDYTNIKFRPMGGELFDYKSGGATDIPIMRVEEMYLIEAEAAGYANLGEGKRLLTEFMRYRMTDGSYNCAGITSFEEFQLEVIRQKRIEFWGEGIIYFDYKRLELGITRGYPGTNHQPDYRLNAEKVAPWWNFCITIGEIQNNRGIPAEANNPDPSGLISPWNGQ